MNTRQINSMIKEASSRGLNVYTTVKGIGTMHPSVVRIIRAESRCKRKEIWVKSVNCNWYEVSSISKFYIQ